MGACTSTPAKKGPGAKSPHLAAEPLRQELDDERLKQVEGFLAEVPLFNCFQEGDLGIVARACELKTYKAGAAVILQGEISTEFFVILSGQASVHMRSDKETNQLAVLKAGDYFGEVALLHDSPRVATIKAESKELCTLAISRQKFQDLQLTDKLSFPCRKAVGAAKFQKAERPETMAKSAEDHALIVQALKANENIHLFVDELTDERMDRVANEMWSEFIAQGSDLITQGDMVADKFYVVQTGEFEVIQGGRIGTNGRPSSAEQVVGRQPAGSSFGELALMYLTPRAATVRATVDSQVWAIDRVSFKEALIAEDNPEKIDEYVRVLGCVPMFAPLLAQEREALAKTLIELQFGEGEVIMTEGQPGDCMFILCQGEVSVAVNGQEQTRLLQTTNPITKWTERKARRKGNDGLSVLGRQKRSNKAAKPSKPLKPSAKADGEPGEVAEQKEGNFAKMIHTAHVAKEAATTWKNTVREQLQVFGERAMESREPRCATVTAVTPVSALRLDVDSCNVLLGPLEDLLRRAAPAGAGAKGSSRVFGVIKKSDLQTLGLLGCGGFGAVYLVEQAANKETYALKAISKGYIIQCGMEESVMNEKRILMMVNSPFIIKLYETYNGSQSIYFLMEAALGGELFATYNRKNLFGSTPHAQFYVGGAICAIEYLHSRRIVYRDLKPENLIITEEGHVKLIDMGLAKIVTGKTYTTCGTPDYFAPEVLEQSGHNHAVDWWTIGILTFELMSGAPPFESTDPLQTYAKIKRGIEKASFPPKFTPPLKALVKELCQRKPEKRLGVRCGGVRQVKEQGWFADFRWEDFMAGSLDPPYKPAVKGKKDMANFKVNQGDLPRQIKYNDPGTGWDDDFATCTDPPTSGGAKASVKVNAEPKAEEASGEAKPEAKPEAPKGAKPSTRKTSQAAKKTTKKSKK